MFEMGRLKRVVKRVGVKRVGPRAFTSAPQPTSERGRPLGGRGRGRGRSAHRNIFPERGQSRKSSVHVTVRGGPEVAGVEKCLAGVGPEWHYLKKNCQKINESRVPTKTDERHHQIAHSTGFVAFGTSMPGRSPGNPDFSTKHP